MCCYYRDIRAIKQSSNQAGNQGKQATIYNSLIDPKVLRANLYSLTSCFHLALRELKPMLDISSAAAQPFVDRNPPPSIISSRGHLYIFPSQTHQPPKKFIRFKRNTFYFRTNQQDQRKRAFPAGTYSITHTVTYITSTEHAIIQRSNCRHIVSQNVLRFG
jgi:hypothetical protein